MGLAQDFRIPGLLVVGAITPDYSAAVIHDKDDRNQIGFRFRGRDLEGDLTAALAESSMDAIENRLLRLREPSQEDLADVLATLSEIYTRAYGGTPPRLTASFRPGQQMREYIRSWIMTWDLNRVAPSYEPDIELDPIADDYVEDSLLEKPSEDDAEGEKEAAR